MTKSAMAVPAVDNQDWTFLTAASALSLSTRMLLGGYEGYVS